MLRTFLSLLATSVLLLTALSDAQTVGGAQMATVESTALSAIPPAPPTFTLEDNLLQWPLPTDADRVYGDIDGRLLHQHVVDQSRISRRYRDTVSEQFWGRIIGTSADAESANWLLEKFERVGLSDVRRQSLDLPPQWFPQQWSITAWSEGHKARLDRSAFPAYASVGTPAEGLHADAVWVGDGSEASYLGKDVKGKAVFVMSTPLPGSMLHSAAEDRTAYIAESKGAVAVFQILALPGNMRIVLYPYRTKIPVFALGLADGYDVRQLIEKAPPSRPPRIDIQMQTRMVPNLKSALVWGTLPGMTDETIYVVAHRDGWFDGATDNASGVAAMLGLAQHFAKVPKGQRRRTIVFIGLEGHHNDMTIGKSWLLSQKERLFGKTALIINAEHTATLQTALYGWQIRRANTYTAQMWYAGGPTRPKLQDIAVAAFRKFGVSIYAEPEAHAPLGDLLAFYRLMPGLAIGDYNMYFHTDLETPDTVPWTGLEATTRAQAKIIDEVNKLPLSELQRPDLPREAMPCDEPRAECYRAL